MRTVLKGAPVVMLASMIWLGPGCGSDNERRDGSAGTANGGAAGDGSEPSNGSGGRGESGANEGGTPGNGEGGANEGGTPGNGEGGASDGGVAGAAMGGTPPEHLGCLSDPLPETAPDNVVTSGLVTTLGAVIIDGALVEGRAVADDGLLDDDTTGLNGAFSITLPTGGTPLDAYLRVSSTGNVDSYVYPPLPFAADYQRDVPLITTALRTGLADEADVMLEADTGLLYLQVLDCNGDPIEGATVTTIPPGDVSYTADSFVPVPNATSTGASGTAYVFNLPPGNVEVDATMAGYSLREHTIQVRANVTTITSVVP
jgi:hypothetical protein